MFYFLYLTLVQAINFHITPDSELSLPLPELLQSESYSCSIKGKFNISTSLPPLITKGLQLSSTIKKSSSSADSVFLINNKILYSGSTVLSIFNFSDPFNISKLNELNYAETDIIAVQPTSGNLLISVEQNGLFRVINLTSNTEIPALQLNLPLINPISCIFLQDLDYWWAFWYNSSSMLVVKFELSKNLASSLFKTLSLSSFSECSGLMRVNIMRSVFYVCDSKKGILTYDLSPVIYTNTGLPSLIADFQHPLLYGQVGYCSLTENFLTVTADKALIIYSLPFLNVVRIYTGEYGLSYSTGNLSVSLSNNHFQVFNLSLYSIFVPVVDTIVDAYNWAQSDQFILASDEDNIFVYLCVEPSLNFPVQYSNYYYKGVLTCGNDKLDIMINASFSSGLFDYRGVSLNSGFLQPNYLSNYTYGEPFEIYLPISNYFSGNNLSYGASCEVGSCQIVNFEKKILDKVLGFGEMNYGMIRGNLSVLVNRNSIYSLMFNGDFTVYFDGIVKNSNNVQDINCVGLMDGYIYVEYINSNQINVQEIISGNGRIIFNKNIEQVEYCNDIIMYRKFAVILRLDCVEVYDVSKNSFLFISSMCFKESSLKISTCEGLCILLNNTSLYQYSLPSLSNPVLQFEFKEAISQLLSSSSYLIAISDTTIYKFSLPSFNLLHSPIICESSLYSLSLQYLSSKCEDLYIIDLNSPSFSSIISSVPYLSSLSFDSTSSFPSIGFSFSGQIFSLYSFGSNITSSMVPSQFNQSSIWVYLTISNDLLELKDSLNLTAESENQFKNKSVEIVLWNAQYLVQNQDFDPNSNRLTSGSIDLRNDDFIGIVPENSFIGNNITFSVIIDEKYVNPSNNCERFKDFCVETKYFDLFSIPTDLPISDFSIVQDTLMTSSGAYINIYDISNTNPVLQNSFKVIDSQNRIFQCLKIILLSDLSNFICSGVYSSSSGLGMYYILLVTTSGEILSEFQIYYQVEWLMVSEKDFIYLYIYEGVGLYHILLNKSIELIAYYSSSTFQVPFSPVSAEYFNASATIIGEKTLGICLIMDNQLFPLMSPPFNSVLTDFFILNDSVLILTESAEGYLISLNDSSIIRHFYKLYPTGYIPFNMQSAINYELGLVIYPIYTSDNSGFLRVLKYETGQIFTDIYINSFQPYSFFRRILIKNDKQILIFHDLAVKDGSVTVQVLGIREEIRVYLKSKDRDDNRILQLSGSVGGKSLQFSQVLLRYESGFDDSSSSSEELSHEWWVWFLVALAVLAGIGIVAVVLVCWWRRRKLGKMKEEQLVINY